MLENKSEKHTKLEHYNIIYLDSLNLESMYIVVERQLNFCNKNNFPPKFLITYDSTGKIIECLSRLNLLDKFIFVVDEFQSIFLDSYFKVGVEFDPTAKDDADPNVNPMDRDIGGMGIFIVKNIMNQVTYQRLEGKNLLTMKKEI